MFWRARTKVFKEENSEKSPLPEPMELIKKKFKSVITLDNPHIPGSFYKGIATGPNAEKSLMVAKTKSTKSVLSKGGSSLQSPQTAKSQPRK